jgi:multiple sugar transport system ATP-binding protein
MNRFEGKPEQDGIRAGDVLLPLSAARLHEARGHERLVVGDRPEHLSIGEGDLTLKVMLVEDLGSDSYIYGHLADDPDSNLIVGPAATTPVPVRWSRSAWTPPHLHLFDAASGLRLGD